MPEEEKSYPATPRRRRRSKRRGQVAKSVEVNSVLVLAGGIFLLRFLGYPLFVKLFCISQTVWSNLFHFASTPQDVYVTFRQLVFYIALYLLPFFLFIFVVALLSNIIQVGFIFSFYPLRPDLNRINPIRGLKRLFSLQAFTKLLISFLKIIIIGFISYLIIKKQLPFIFSLTGGEMEKIFIYTKEIVFKLPLFLCLGAVPLALFDYVLQKRRHEKELRMSREEFKEELKQTEGDPLIKSRIRTLQRQLLKSRMMQKVPQADVVITNPQHVAVALQYDREKMNAPVVLAKGAGFIAERIKEIARRYEVPIVEHKWLAQMLYKSVEIGEEIPVKFYQAVAEVLAYVYRLKKRRF